MGQALMPRTLFTADFDMKNEKSINLIKAVIIIAAAVLILFGIDRVFLLKSEDGISQLEALNKQKENTVDVIFLGSSHVYCDISTGVLWDNYGIASFDLGGAEAPAWVSYYHLKEALKNQNPALVCYEISVASLYPTLYQSDSWAADNNYGMSISSDRFWQLKANSEEQDLKKRIFPISVMHGRYSDLTENDFRDKNNSINYKGYDPRERVTPLGDYEGCPETAENTPCSEKAEEYIRKIIELCRENNVELMFFVSPYKEGQEEKAMYNYIDAIADEYDVEHIDFNSLVDEMGIDFNTDMHDYTHLNFWGNYKFSDSFGKIIKEGYNVPDRRGDENFASWEVDSKRQRVERVSNELYYSQTDPVLFMNNLVSEGFDVFVTIKEGVDAGLSEDLSAALENIGVPKDKQLSGASYILRDNTIIAELSGGFRASFKEGNTTLLFLEEGEGDYYHTVSLFKDDDEYKEDYANNIFVYDYVNGSFIESISF